MNKKVIPFLKWAGGKRWLLSSYASFFPQSYRRYIEPFLGSGAAFFYLQPKNAVLADANMQLIETYQAIKDDWKRVVMELRKHHRSHNKSYFYKTRETKFYSPYTRAAQFIYLNRTCWNGLYRVNLKGVFNVPKGTKKDVVLASDDFESTAKLLQNAMLLHSDFEPIINEATKGDLVFVDPPYTVKHNLNNFIKYNESLFSWEDQIRLRDCLVLAKQRGARVVVTNAWHRSVRKLYADIGDLHRVRRFSVLAADSNKRKACDELVIII